MTERPTVSLNGKSVDAIAVTAHVFLLVAATYAIFVQLLFTATWNIVFNILLWNLHDGDRIEILEVYVPWGSIPNAVAVSTDEGDGPILFGFTSLLHPAIGTKKQDLIARLPSWCSHHKRRATQKAAILGI